MVTYCGDVLRGRRSVSRANRGSICRNRCAGHCRLAPRPGDGRELNRAPGCHAVHPQNEVHPGQIRRSYARRKARQVEADKGPTAPANLEVGRVAKVGPRKGGIDVDIRHSRDLICMEGCKGNDATQRHNQDLGETAGGPPERNTREAPITGHDKDLTILASFPFKRKGFRENKDTKTARGFAPSVLPYRDGRSGDRSASRDHTCNGRVNH